MILTIPDVDFQIAVDSIEDNVRIYGEAGKRGVGIMLISGGFMVMQITQEMLDNSLAYFKDNPDAQANMGQIKAGPMICMLKEVAEQLKKDEIMAIVLHERGHLLKNHLVNLQETMVLGNTGVQMAISLEQELEADAYAASIVGAATVQRALRRAIEISAQLIKRIAKEWRGQDFDMEAHLLEIMNTPMMAGRIARLDQQLRCAL